LLTNLSLTAANPCQGCKNRCCQARSGLIGARLPVADEADDEVRTVFEPDLWVVCDPRKIDPRGVRGAPDVVTKVLSPSTTSFRSDREMAGLRARRCP